MTHIENILPEVVGGEVHRLSVDDADKLSATAIKDIVTHSTGCSLTTPDGSPTTNVEELIALCTAVLRSHWQKPLTMLDGQSLQDLIRRLIGDRVKGDDTFGIPAFTDSLSEAVSAIEDRKISGAPVADGMSLVRLFCDSALNASLTTLTDPTTGWTMDKAMPWSSLPNVTKATFNCIEKTIEFTAPSSLTELYLPYLEKIMAAQKIYSCNGLVSLTLPSLTTYDTRGTDAHNCLVYKCLNMEELIMPKLEYIHHYSRVGTYAFMISDMPVLRKLVFGKIKTFAGSWTGYANFFDKVPNLIHLEVGQGSESSMDLRYWSPTTALSSNLLQFLSNFREFICDRLADRTDKPTLTLTLSSAVYDAISADTEYGIMDALAAKNWTVASA